MIKTHRENREKVSAIGLVTWAIRNYDEAFKTFLYGIEKGIDNIDTAETHVNGKAEEFAGRLLRVAGCGNIFITTEINRFPP